MKAFSLLLYAALLHMIMTLATKDIHQSCLCDVSDVCDFECCCDKQCSTILKQQLSYFGKCEDDGFGIPWCQAFNETDIHVKDLYSGLGTIYTIIRRLFCLQRINIITVGDYYVGESSNITIEKLINQSEAHVERTTSLSPSIESLQKITIDKVILSNGLGNCQIGNQVPKFQSIPSKKATKQCRTKLDPLTVQNHQILSSSTFLSGSSFSSINLYNMDEPTTSIPTIYKPDPPACSDGKCTNLLRFLKLYLREDGSLNTQYSYAFIGSVNLNNEASSNPIGYVTVSYSYQYLNSNNSLPKVSSQGYDIGSKLILMKSTDSSYVNSPNPINLAFRGIDQNQCRESNGSSETSDRSFIALEFGKDAEYGCIGDSSLMYDHLKGSFDFVGKYAFHSNILNDYLGMNWPSIDASSSIKLIFNYLKVGAAENWQYYIVSAKVEQVQSISGELKLYVEYVQIPNEKILYVPQPPQVSAYLPNDFLYPFYVAS